MTKREYPLAGAFAGLLFLAFWRLLLHPSLIPGNFGDIYAYHYPLRHLVSSTLQEGHLPLWNPYIFAGTPLAANPQAVLFYPGSAIQYFFPLNWAFSFDCFAHLFFAWLGAYLLLRKWELDRAGAWLLAASYAASPFLVTRIPQGIPTHIAGLSWIPWIWLFAQGSSFLLWSGTLALQILSGHPQFAMLNLLALGLWTLLRRPSKIPWLIGGTALALALDWAQAGATLQFLAHSVRTQWNPGYSLGYSLKPSYLWTFLYPNAFGNPSDAAFSLFPSEYFEMLTAYIGLIPLILAVAGLVKNRTLWAMLGAGLFFALGQNNPAFLPVQRVLALDFLRVPSRFLVVILWTLWLAAAIGWRTHCARRKSWLKGALIIVGTADVLFWSLPWVFAQESAQFLGSNPPVLEQLRDPGYRFATAPEIASANKAMLYRIYNATGYEAFYLAPIAIYTSHSEGQAAADGSRTYIRQWETPSMERLAVKHYLDGDGNVLENPDAETLVQGAQSWSMPTAERFEVSADGPSELVFAQADYPGWKAWVDGEASEVRDEGGLFPSIHLERKGGRRIFFVFIPWLWYAGVGISLLTLAIIVSRVFRGLNRWTS